MNIIALGSLACLLLGGTVTAQVRLEGEVVDRAGRPVPGAVVESGDPPKAASADRVGHFALDVASSVTGGVVLRVQARGMEPQIVTISVTKPVDPVEIVLQPSKVHQEATVTATRSMVEIGPAAVTQSSLSATDLRQFPSLTLDESLRQHAGFELFRRSSGWVQNPTSQGISLRGLGSTAASRTLVLADNAPLNDAFGGWIHWNELPAPAVEAVAITSGGGSDLYGSNALGGVIDLVPARPFEPRADLSLAAASEDTRTSSARADVQQRQWHESLAAEDLRTAGYILVEPASRGSVDVPANVHFENTRLVLERSTYAGARLFVTGNVLNEARGNGTPLTTNGTRLWRYLAGGDWNAGTHASGRARLFGSDEGYRQSFSSIPLNRATEALSRTQSVRTQELGASADATFHLAHVALVAGADLRDLRATDVERPLGTAPQDTSARQRFAGGFAEILAERGRWSGTVSLRLDSAANLDTKTLTGNSLGLLTNRSEIVASPRIGVVRQLTGQVALHGSGFRAFRTPTMNELYRTGQVGQQTTRANASLASERATGAEGGVALSRARLRADATFFWTEINRPVAALVLSSTPTSTLLMRENFGQIQSQGVESTVAVNEGHAVSLAVGYQYAHAVVTSFSAQPTLVAKWIPAVARESATAQVHLRRARMGELTVSVRDSGRAFDDTANLFVLHSFFQLDAYAERGLGRGFTAFVSIQNLLDRRADVARTPILTQGIPLVAQGGLRFAWSGR